MMYDEESEISEYSDYTDILLHISENQQSQIEQTETLIQDYETIIEQNHQILTYVSYMFVIVLALLIYCIFSKLVSVIDGA